MTDIDGDWPDPPDDDGAGWTADGPVHGQPDWWPPPLGDDPPPDAGDLDDPLPTDDLMRSGDGDPPVDAPLDDPAPSWDTDGGAPPPAGVDVPVGADPDLPVGADPGGHFPAPLTFDGLPEPVDGYPWVDVGLLGDTPVDVPPAGAAPPAVTDLAGWAGSTAGDWAALAADTDPMTSALARFWGDLPPADDAGR
ncbi:hypothetical protein V6U90_25740 [Micromonospora sp. CPCC 206060]|uniref:hypothetical protein n=1 Tax=Micromonospora sp. CPCC 206060 TaxID=3122406 RepID=UPI002FEE713C